MKFDDKELDQILESIEKVASTIVVVATAVKSLYDLWSDIYGDKKDKKE